MAKSLHIDIIMAAGGGAEFMKYIELIAKRPEFKKSYITLDSLSAPFGFYLKNKCILINFLQIL